MGKESEVDFNAMVAETRAKMQEKSKKRPNAPRKVLEISEAEHREIETETPAATGWWRNGGPAHWIQEGKALCGREMPAGFILGTTDPDHPDYQSNQCRKCVKALDKQGDEAFAAALAQSFRVRVRATGIEGTVPTGQVNSKGTVSVRYDTYRYGDRNEVEFQPAELEVLPALTIGDRVFFATQPNRRAATIVGNYGDEGLPLSVKLEYDDGEKGGGHVGNMLRFIDDAPQEQLAEEASEEITPEPAPTPAELPGTPVLLPVLQLVPWNQIDRSRLNPRKKFDPESLRELAVSIYKEGLQQNLVVRPSGGGRFEIAAGERRHRAIGLLVQGFEVGEGEQRDWLQLPADHPVPVLVRQLDDLALLEAATAENMQRRRMSPMEEADAFAAMVEHGGEVHDIVAKFGYGRRTVVRRIQISKNLLPEIREKFEDGVLTLAQVEVLASVGQETQKQVWDSVKRNPRAYDVAGLRKELRSYSFLVKHRQFPPSWYTGGIAQNDLFGDIDPYFEDAAQALALQVKHASHLADKDVENGAAFADVAFGAYTWMYSGPGEKGVVYNINPRTGEMKRWAAMGQPPTAYGYRKPEYRAGKVEEVAKTSPASPTSPAPSPTQHTAAVYGKVELTDVRGRVYRACVSDGRFAKALFICAASENFPLTFPTPEHQRAVDDLVARSGKLFEVEGNYFIPGERGSADFLAYALPLVLGLPDEQLDLVHQSLMLGQVTSVLHGSDWLHAAYSANEGFKLTAEYLEACNDQALEELWDDAGMGSRENTSPEYLRAMLLEDADRLAGEGFLPRPVQPEPLEPLEEDGEDE